MRPFVKWAGGKTNLLEPILAMMPSKIDRYHEPFIGGGAVFFELAKQKRIKDAFLSDSNVDLIVAYKVVRDSLSQLIGALEPLQADALSENREARFYDVRAMDPNKLQNVERAARFIFLNKTCYNGLHRVNQKGGFNVPFGRYKNPNVCDHKTLREASEALKRANIEVAQFDKHGIVPFKDGDVAYFDPPYLPVKKASKKDGVAATSFTAYDAKFGKEEHERLAGFFTSVARAVGPKGVALLSNADTPLAHELYAEHEITSVSAPRAINRDKDGRGAVTEILVRGRHKVSS